MFPGDVPTLTQNFCGREDIVTSVLEQVRSAKSDRVITLVGPPGFGKTSIAIAVGQHLIEEKEVGVAFVPLRGALDKQQVANRIVSTLSPRSSDNPTDLKSLRELVKALPANTLVVLDNAEDAINPELQGNRSNEPGFETVVNDILGSNKSVKVLVTSRVKFQPLDFRVSEHLVGGLQEQNAKLLLSCLCTIRNADHAVQIVRLCGHVPLAICIAAGIMKYEGLSSKELLQTFEKSGLNAIDTEEGWLRNPEHHLVKMIKAAVNRLPEKLQFAFCGFSLFTNPFTAEAATAVLGAKDNLELKRSFAAGLQKRCLIDFDTVSGRFSMQPLLSQFGREVCSEHKKKLFHRRFSFYFLDLLRQEILKLPEHPANSVLFVHFLQLEYPHLCTALTVAESLDRAQVKALRPLNAAAHPLANFFGTVAMPFLGMCICVASTESDRQWLYSSLLAELAVTVPPADKASASQHVKKLLNFFEQEKVSTEWEREMVNWFRLKTLLTLPEDESNTLGNYSQKLAREIHNATSPSTTGTSAGGLLLRLTSIIVFHQTDWLSDFRDAFHSLVSALEELMNRVGSSEEVQICLCCLGSEITDLFATAILPAPLGLSTEGVPNHYLLLEICDLSRQLFRMVQNAEAVSRWPNKHLGDLQRPVWSCLVAGCLMRLPQLDLLHVSVYGLSLGHKWSSISRLVSLCARKDAVGIATFLVKIASASTAEKAYFYFAQKASAVSSVFMCKDLSKFHLSLGCQLGGD